MNLYAVRAAVLEKLLEVCLQKNVVNQDSDRIIHA